MFCQLIRVYAQVFGVRFFEVESFQFGDDNEEGIASGAFWFYYRYGFRPTEPAIRKLASNEWNKLSASRSHETSGRILKQLASGNLVLNLGRQVPMSVYDVTRRVKHMIRHEYQNEVEIATQDCRRRLLKAVGSRSRFNPDEQNVLGEFALWSRAFQINNKKQLALMIRMVKAKPVDVYQYQKLLLELLVD